MVEKLDLEKLAQVVGGSSQEIAELKAAMLGNPRLKPIWDKYMAEFGDEYDATVWGVAEALDLSFTACAGTEPNKYGNTRTYSHESVLRRLKNY